VWNRAAAKIHSPPLCIKDHFYLVGIEWVLCLIHPLGEGDDITCRFVLKGANDGVDLPGIDKRFVTLDIYQYICPAKLFGRFRTAIRTALVGGAGQHYLAVKGTYVLGNALIISSHPNIIE